MQSCGRGGGQHHKPPPSSHPRLHRLRRHDIAFVMAFIAFGAGTEGEAPSHSPFPFHAARPSHSGQGRSLAQNHSNFLTTRPESVSGKSYPITSPFGGALTGGTFGAGPGGAKVGAGPFGGALTGGSFHARTSGP